MGAIAFYLGRGLTNRYLNWLPNEPEANCKLHHSLAPWLALRNTLAPSNRQFFTKCNKILKIVGIGFPRVRSINMVACQKLDIAFSLKLRTFWGEATVFPWAVTAPNLPNCGRAVPFYREFQCLRWVEMAVEVGCLKTILSSQKKQQWTGNNINNSIKNRFWLFFREPINFVRQWRKWWVRRRL